MLTISPKRLETRSSPLRNAAAASPPLPPPMYEPEHGASDVSFFGSSTQGGLRYQPPEHVVRLQSYCSGGRGDDDIEMMQFSPSPRSQRSQWSQRGSDGEGGGRVTDAKSSSRVTSFFLSWLGRAGDRSSSGRYTHLDSTDSPPRGRLRTGTNSANSSPCFSPTATPRRSIGSGSSRVPQLQQQGRACPASPPPTYPSPPTYRTPPRSAYALGMTPDTTTLLTGMDLSQIYEDDVGDLAPVRLRNGYTPARMRMHPSHRTHNYPPHRRTRTHNHPPPHARTHARTHKHARSMMLLSRDTWALLEHLTSYFWSLLCCNNVYVFNYLFIYVIQFLS